MPAALIDLSLPEIVEGFALVKPEAHGIEGATGSDSGSPDGEDACNQAYAGACADGDPGWLLAAHIKRNDPSRGEWHKDQADEADTGEGCAEQACGDGEGESGSQGGLPVDGGCITGPFGPALGLAGSG